MEIGACIGPGQRNVAPVLGAVNDIERIDSPESA
jgi:hypothetical protein